MHDVLQPRIIDHVLRPAVLAGRSVVLDDHAKTPWRLMAIMVEDPKAPVMPFGPFISLN